jgi:hypothetical protein
MIVYFNGRANASSFINYSLLLFWLFRCILYADCLCLPQAGGLLSGWQVTHFSICNLVMHRVIFFGINLDAFALILMAAQ